MNCNRLVMKCECGAMAQPHSFWITDTKAVLVTCLCINCEKVLHVLFHLSDLWKACPKPDPTALLNAVDQQIHAICEGNLIKPYDGKDLEFLKGMGITEIL